MKTTTEQSPFWKFFNFKRISDVSGIHPDKLYNNLKGIYSSLGDGDKTRVADIIMPQITELMNFLGYSVSFKKKALEAELEEQRADF